MCARFSFARVVLLDCWSSKVLTYMLSVLAQAYRQMARKWHPDVNQEAGAKEKFQSINEAYQVLSNPELRARYDQFGMAGVRSGAAGAGPGMQDFDLGDIFESFFGGQAGGARRRGPTQVS